MFAEVERLLKEMNENVLITNKILAKIEENLRVPDVITWARVLKEVQKLYSVIY